MSEPNRVVRTSRTVIERKLLTALEDGNTVAILASRQDLRDLITALDKRQATSDEVLDWAGTCNRQAVLLAGLNQLFDEAFQGPTKTPP